MKTCSVVMLQNLPISDAQKKNYIVQSALSNIGVSIGVSDYNNTARFIDDAINRCGIGAGVEIQTIAPDILPIQMIRQLRKDFGLDLPIKLSVATDFQAALEAIDAAQGYIDIGLGHGPGFRCIGKAGAFVRGRAGRLRFLRVRHGMRYLSRKCFRHLGGAALERQHLRRCSTPSIVLE